MTTEDSLVKTSTGWRHSQRVLGLILVVLQVLSFSLSVLPANTQLSQGVSWLHTCGTQICNDQNQPVLISGPNFTGGDAQGLNLADIQRIKALGFNSIRVLGLSWRRLQPYGPGLDGIDVSYFNGTGNWPLLHGLDQVVDWIAQENMYLILVPTWWTQYERPPAWAFPNTPDYPHDDVRWTSLLNGTATRETTGFMNLWRFIADRYKNVPNIIFELFNEPFVLDDSLAGIAYKTFNENIISAIESVETKSHLKLVELLMDHPSWMEIVGGAMDLNKANVAWALHYYAPMTGWDPNGSYWHQPYTWLGQQYPEGWGNATTFVIWRIGRVADKVRQWNKPLLVTEFAKDTGQQNWKQWYDVVLSTLAQYGNSALILHEYASNQQYNVGYNINNPTTQLGVMNVLDSYLGTTTTSTTSSSTSSSTTSSTTTSSTSTSSSTTTSSTISTSTTAPTTQTGLDAIGGTTSSAGLGNHLYGMAITASASGTLTSIGINVQSTGSSNIVLGIYSTISNNVFSGLLDQSSSTAAVPGWNDLSVSPVNIVQGTTYYLVIACSKTAYNLVVYDAAGAGYYAPGAYPTFPDPTGTVTSGDYPYTYNMRITYTPAVTLTTQTTTATSTSTSSMTTQTSTTTSTSSTSSTTTFSPVTVTLLNSNGNGLSGAVVQYYSGGWKSFGTTSSGGTVSMALPPDTYVFQITYAGATNQKSQNVGTSPNVVFQTVKVHSDSGKCVKYTQVTIVPSRYPGSGSQTFTQDIELLPGTYMFSFSDKTKDTSYTLVVGALKHIH